MVLKLMSLKKEVMLLLDIQLVENQLLVLNQ